jgi:MerR family transcriptional regulator, light-induced transcriptional regulator
LYSAPMRRDRFGDNYSTVARYNTKVVVRETAVPADTFRAWERRYGMPRPHRTETGQRLYSERDIAIIRWLRDRTAEGLTISQAVRLVDGGNREHAVEAEPDPTSWVRLRAQLADALLHLDTLAAEAVMSHAFARFNLDDVCLLLIEPVLVQIGADWHAGKISVGQEHFATAFLRRKLQALLSVYDVVAGTATIIAAGAPGEQHDVGLLILALALVRRGYRVVYLGADVPVVGLLPVVEQVRPDMVCLTATTPATGEQVPVVAAAVRNLKIEDGQPPLVVAGGKGVDVLTGPAGEYTIIRGNALVAVEQIGELLAHARKDDTD